MLVDCLNLVPMDRFMSNLNKKYYNVRILNEDN